VRETKHVKSKYAIDVNVACIIFHEVYAYDLPCERSLHPLQKIVRRKDLKPELLG